MPRYGQYIAIGSGGTVPTFKQINTGALLAGDNTITTGVILTSFTYVLQDDTNLYMVNSIKPDPANPTTKIIINVIDAIPAGLTLTIIGTP